MSALHLTSPLYFSSVSLGVDIWRRDIISFPASAFLLPIMATFSFFKALVFTVFIQNSIALISCPVPVIETSYTNVNGAKFTICPDTDYRGTTLVLHKKIASTTACVKLVRRFPYPKSSYFSTSGVLPLLRAVSKSFTRLQDLCMLNANARGLSVVKIPHAQRLSMTQEHLPAISKALQQNWHGLPTHDMTLSTSTTSTFKAR